MDPESKASYEFLDYLRLLAHTIILCNFTNKLKNMKKIIVLAIILTLLSCGESSKSKRKSFVPKWKNGQELCFMDKKVIMTTYNWSNDCIVQWVDNNGDIQTEIMLETSLKICE